ncbi:MAG: hypothetical protein C0179_05290 [Fervidicoccus sp.]|nr:MAG: hypothetical protein C0179_05290 [Fervidicoccus sp.]
MTEWKTIRVRSDVYEIIKKYSEMRGIPISSVIAQALTFMDLQRRRPRVKEQLPLADKFAWYITKVLMSAGAFKENPSQENYDYLVKNFNDLEDRLGVETSMAREAVDRLFKKKKETWTADDKIEFNSAFKSLVLQMIWLLEKEEEKMEGS